MLDGDDLQMIDIKSAARMAVRAAAYELFRKEWFFWSRFEAWEQLSFLMFLLYVEQEGSRRTMVKIGITDELEERRWH